MGFIANAFQSVSKAVGSVFGAKPKPAAPAAPKPVQNDQVTPEQQQEEDKKRRLLALNAARIQGQMTPAGGVQDPATVSRKTLLGM